DQPAIAGARECRDAAFDLGGIAQVDRAQLHTQRWRHDLNGAELTIPEATVGSRSTTTRVTPGAISLSSSNHFPLMLYSKTVNPVALPPGCARLATKPAPTGSTTVTNTIGTLRVACCNAATDAVPDAATRTSGASATSSAACLRNSSALAVARVSMRRL